MRRRYGALGAAAALAVLAGCAAPAPAPAPAAVRFVPVALPDGAVPQVLAAAGDHLFVGVHVPDRPVLPALVDVAPDGSAREIPTAPSTPYGRTATWYALASDGTRVLGVGGDRGGAHGNVRWSVWSGSPGGVAEQTQAFSTFGGWGAGDLVGAVLTPGGEALVGSWQSADAGLDVAVWDTDGQSWTRRDSTGTPLASTRSALGFATGAAADTTDVVVAGWQVTAERSGQAPVVWRSTPDGRDWTRTPLPDAGTSGTAGAVGCAGTRCAVAGRVDGVLALWLLDGGSWSRVAGVPPVPVGDEEHLAAPVVTPAGTAQVVSDQGRVTVVTVGATLATRPADGPTGTVVAAAAAGTSLYVVAGDPARPQLWRAQAP